MMGGWPRARAREESNLALMQVAPNVTMMTRPDTLDAHIVHQDWRKAPVRARGGTARRTPGIFERYAQPRSEDRWLDGGAHIGAFTLWLLLHGVAHVLAVEAAPANYALLQHNLGLNPYLTAHGRCTALQGALWPYGPRVPLYLNGGQNTGAHSTIVKRGRKAVLVPTHNLFSLIINYACNCLKLDVEGSELTLLENLPEEGWARLRCLVLQFHFNALRDTDHTKYQRVAQLLKAHFPHTHTPTPSKHWQMVIAGWH